MVFVTILTVTSSTLLYWFCWKKLCIWQGKVFIQFYTEPVQWDRTVSQDIELSQCAFTCKFYCTFAVDDSSSTNCGTYTHIHCFYVSLGLYYPALEITFTQTITLLSSLLTSCEAGIREKLPFTFSRYFIFVILY